MRAKLIICRGIPGSGKSYWAAQQTNAIIVNRDDIRREYDCVGAGWSKEKEIAYIIPEMNKRIRDGLREGSTVISSDTNLNRMVVAKLVDMSIKFGALLEIKVFNTPIDICIERDALRSEPWRVGAEEITRYYWTAKEEGLYDRVAMESNPRPNPGSIEGGGTN